MESYRIDNLLEELVHEILLKLPLKTLLVCKCVCKDWCAIIKSPSFVNQHYNLKNNQEYLVVYGVDVSEDDDGEQVYKDAFFMYDDEKRSLVEAPNHLLQMPAYMITEGLEKGIFCLRLSSLLGLFNPATREFKKLPPIPELHRQGIKDCPWIGCGLDPSSGDFKVVAFKQDKDYNYASVYNLSSESWKTVETIDPYDKIGYSESDCNGDGVPTLNGVKHWLAECANSKIYSILAFDMRSEKFQKIAIPDALGKTEKSLNITTYCDSVGIFSYKCNESVDLWVMGRDGLWSKKFSIGPYEDVSPLLVWKKNKVLTLQLEYLTMCDVSTKEARTLETMDRVTFIDGCFIYKESLVSIKGERVDCLEDVFGLWLKSSRRERRG